MEAVHYEKVEKWPWRFFTPYEMACHEDGELLYMDDNFMLKLETLRVLLDEPLVVSSAYRTPEHNDRVSTTGRDGPHTTGRAVDLKVQGALAYRVLALAPTLGFTGLGVSQITGAPSFIHLDDLGGKYRPNVWSY